MWGTKAVDRCCVLWNAGRSCVCPQHTCKPRVLVLSSIQLSKSNVELLQRAKHTQRQVCIDSYEAIGPDALFWLL